MPSASEERRVRVVTEIDSVRSRFLSCSNIRVSVVLPAPEGEDRIRIMPRRVKGKLGLIRCSAPARAIARFGRAVQVPGGGATRRSPSDLRTGSGSCRGGSRASSGSFDVLHLLAQLLDLDAQFKSLAGERRVVRLPI